MELRFRAFWSVTLDLSSLPQAELCRVSSQVFTVTVTVTAGLNFSRIWSQVLRQVYKVCADVDGTGGAK